VTTETRTRYIRATTHIEILPETGSCKVVAWRGQRRARRPKPSVGIVDCDTVLRPEETRQAPPRRTTAPRRDTTSLDRIRRN
jgi:hypothetical protein